MHIKFRLLTCFTLIAAMLLSCNDQSDTDINNIPNAITFVSGISKHATRINQEGSQWIAGDQIGIYMVESGNKTTVLNYSNVPYAAELSAQTTVFKPSERNIIYPADESPVDFIAYYPYSSTLSDWSYPVSLADQSASLVAHDLMIAKADNGGNGFTSGSISLGFTHQLSRIIMNFVDEENNVLTPDTEGLVIKGMNTTANFDIKTGTLSNAATVANIIPYKNANSFEAILLPFTIAAGHEVTLMADGHQYQWTMNNSHPGLEIKAGYSYTFKVIVKTSATEVEAVLVDYNGNSIAPWGDGGNDNKTKEPTEDIEIPADYEKIELPTGGSIKSALSSATSSKVAIVLADGGSYSENTGFSVPASITSLMIVGEGGTTAPSVYIASSVTISGDMDLLQLYNLDLNGIFENSYFMNQEESITIKQISIESCRVHDMRGIIRLKAGTPVINSYKITDCIFYHINTYNLLAVEAGSVPSIEVTKSTIYNLAGRGINISAETSVPPTVTIDQCTFNQGPKYAIVQFNGTTKGSLTFTNNIIGLPFDTSRGVSAGSNAESTTASGNYYVSDTTWQGTAVGEDCGYTAATLFADPEKGDFTQSKLTSGDPRWY